MTSLASVDRAVRGEPRWALAVGVASVVLALAVPVAPLVGLAAIWMGERSRRRGASPRVAIAGMALGALSIAMVIGWVLDGRA